MLKAVILDDEVRGSKLLSYKLEYYKNEIQLEAVFNDPIKALKEIGSLDADVLFLDVEMPGMNGFQFLEKLAGFNFEVIFTTAYDSYTLEALRLSAVDYLLKPIVDEELEEAIVRLKKRIKDRAASTPKHAAHDFTGNRLSISTAEGVYFVMKANIIHIEAMSNYCTFYLTDGKKIVVSKTLKEYEGRLTNDSFLRVNRSSMVNLNHINRYRKGNGGTLEMSDGVEIEVSPQRRDGLVAVLFGNS
ncbi:two-component system LytT family response regulator [Algoriphagus sp. 4150]|uniref:LytR/AlgR family response regulator transcription factor n=1 Tax=Algoriphagus sp. 4150 TaxID=2817756 RepID=UPI00285B7988|nr:LytTR family DNA-binding domain-containing protein [Algoriphagus sp. 4150]MDR7131810.1 two-component system LytT family response regulator [Algoriphagus sp. 4150]